MKEGWTYKKLGEVCVSELGKTLNQSKDKGELRPYLCALNIQWDKIDKTTLKETRFEQKELERYSIRKGDLLVCEGGDVGRSAIWTENGTIQYQNALHRIRFNGDILNRFCLYYLYNLKLNGEIDNRYAKGVTIKHLVKSSLLSIPIPVPPLQTQQSIVDELDKINDLIKLKKSQLSDLDNLAQSIFYEMFGDPVENEKGWEVKTFGEIGSFLRGKSILKSDFVENGLPCIHYGQIHTKFGHSVKKHLSEIPKDLYNKSIIASTGDVLIAITSEDLEGSCKSTAWLGDYDIAVSAHAAVFKHNQNPLYIVFYIHSKNFYYEKEKYARGFKVMEIKPQDIAKIPIPLPPLSLQQTFSKKIEAIEEQKKLINSTIKDLETLLASRMQYWFD